MPLEDEPDDPSKIVIEMDEEGNPRVRAGTLNKLVRTLTLKSNPGITKFLYTKIISFRFEISKNFLDNLSILYNSSRTFYKVDANVQY